MGKKARKIEKLIITVEELMLMMRRARRELEPLVNTHRVHKSSKKDKKRNNNVKDFE